MSKVLIKFKNHMTFKNKKISLLGFGAWGLGGDAYGEISNQKSLNLLKYSIANGVNFIDTSNIYGKGLSEKRIGLLLLKNKKIRPKLSSYHTLSHSTPPLSPPPALHNGSRSEQIRGRGVQEQGSPLHAFV